MSRRNMVLLWGPFGYVLFGAGLPYSWRGLWMCCHYWPLGTRAGESVGSKQDQKITEQGWWGIAGTYWSKEVISPREKLAEDSQLRKRKERNFGGETLWAERVLFGYIVCNNLPYLTFKVYVIPHPRIISPKTHLVFDLLEEILPRSTDCSKGFHTWCLAWTGLYTPLQYKIWSSPLLLSSAWGPQHEKNMGLLDWVQRRP